MDFSLSSEQQQLKDSADKFAVRGYGFTRHQATLRQPGHLDHSTWAQLAEFGWLALPLPESAGGLGGSGVDVSLVAESLGVGMVLEPFISGLLLPGKLIALAGSNAQQESLLIPLAEGRLQLAVAWAESSARQDPAHCETLAERNDDGWLLRGRKLCVLNAPNAERLLVSARTAGASSDEKGISLFEVSVRAAGVTLESYPLMGGGVAANITLDHVQLSPDALLGSADEGFAALDAALDHATVAACAQALGAMGQLLDRTLSYLRVRKQFGVAIGSFQVLQHRAVDMFIELEQSRSMVLMAAVRVDSLDARERRLAVSAAKAYLCKAAKFVAQQAVQLHGGIGVTEELDVGHYFRQLTAFGTLHGDRERHLDRYAALSLAA